MAGAALPDPMGGTTSTFLSLVVDIIPVRVVNTNPIAVQVINFPGQPPPVPNAFGSVKASTPLLPGEKLLPKPMPKPAAGLGLNDVGLGNIAKLGSVAGLAAAGVGLVTSAFGEFKSAFIDPIIGAAKGGFDKGVARGSGASILETAAEGLGIVFGLILMPITFKLAASFLAAARAADEWTEYVERHAGFGFKQLQKGPAGLTQEAMGGLGGSLGGLGMILGPETKQSLIGGMLGSTAKPLKKTAEGEGKAMQDIFNLFMRQQGTAPAAVGIGDIRQQAQLAAMTDPLEAEYKKMMIEGAKKVMENMGYLKQTADNTAAPVLGAKA